MHDDQLDVDEDLVTELLAEQFPELAGLPIRKVSGAATVNAVFRIGDHAAARLPLRADAPHRVRAWLESESAAVTEFADASPFPAPRVIGLGEAGHDYPLPWAVHTWLPGPDASVDDPSVSVGFAEDLAVLLTALRSVDVRGRTFRGAGRGGTLTDHDGWMATCFERSEGLLDVPRLRTLWGELRDLPVVDDNVLCHGDLTPFNVLAADGRLAGVVDTGGFAPADPALDLVAAWHILDADPRQVLRDRLHCGDMQWLRGMAWAFEQAVGLVHYYVDSNPPLSRLGRRTLARIVAAWDTAR